MKQFLPKLLVLAFFACTQVHAQETTATLNGLVLDSKGIPLTSASVIVKHEPTGYSTGTQTNNKGIFILPNLKPGGPYTIIVSSTGYRKDTIDNVNLTLGNNAAGNITLEQQDQMLTEVVVTTGGR
ncbi:MAG TPA: carboxypeptidase-like regulatory domain-containing protein, partial [Niastella sp.]